jgi:hypothetical protein
VGICELSIDICDLLPLEHLELYVNSDKYDIIREYIRKDNSDNYENYSDGTLSILKNNESVNIKKKNDLEKFIELNKSKFAEKGIKSLRYSDFI